LDFGAKPRFLASTSAGGKGSIQPI